MDWFVTIKTAKTKASEWPLAQTEVCKECGSLHDWRYIKTGWCCNCGAEMDSKEEKD